MIIAADFPKQVTHSVVWLSEMSLDIDLIQVGLWKVEGHVVAGFTKVYPTPEVEEFTLAPARVEGEAAAKKLRLRGIDTTLLRAEELRHEWDGVMALMDGSQPSVLHLYQERAEEHRNTEGWHYAHELSYQGPALVRVGEYLAHRADTERPAQTERARVALTRSTHDTPAVSPASPQVPPASHPPTPRRSR
ncbi:hypothetical protein [Streptomyces sp. rh34]|uniref:hypothetical protein n=1 Tax=Streptomyces sp. rh34 TaxID=2034272 RepID=UPI00211D4EA5|nr:hypothetical protein [Streptomyces sp. rh34]